MTPKINCSLVEQWLYLSLDGELSPELEEQLDAHLDACGQCRRLQAEVMENERLLNSELDSITDAMDVLLAGRIDSRSIQRLEEESRASQRRDLPRSWATVRNLAAMLLIVIAGAVIFWPSTDDSTESLDVAAISWSGESPQVRSGAGVSRELDGTDAATGSVLRAGDVVDVPAGASLEVEYAGGSRVTVTGPAQFREAEDGRLHLDIESGAYHFRIQKAAAGFSVSTPLGHVSVVGTEFTVEHRLEPVVETRVEVLEGVVEVRPNALDNPWPLAAGQIVEFRPGHTQMKSAVVASPDPGVAPAKPGEDVTKEAVDLPVGGVRDNEKDETNEEEKTNEDGREKG